MLLLIDTQTSLRYFKDALSRHPSRVTEECNDTFSQRIGTRFELQAQNQPSLLALVLAWCLAFIRVVHVLNEVGGVRTLCIAV